MPFIKTIGSVKTYKLLPSYDDDGKYTLKFDGDPLIIPYINADEYRTDILYREYDKYSQQFQLEENKYYALPERVQALVNPPAKMNMLDFERHFGADALSLINHISFYPMLQLQIISDLAFERFTGACFDLNALFSLRSIGSYAFSGCRGSKFLDFSNNSNLKEIGNSAFFGNDLTESVYLTGRELSYVGAQAFSKCCNLKSLTIKNTVPLNIGARCFESCEKLTDIDLSGCSNVTIGENSFFGCMNVQRLVFPANIRAEQIPGFVDMLFGGNAPKNMKIIIAGARNIDNRSAVPAAMSAVPAAMSVDSFVEPPCSRSCSFSEKSEISLVSENKDPLHINLEQTQSEGCKYTFDNSREQIGLADFNTLFGGTAKPRANRNDNAGRTLQPAAAADIPNENNPPLGHPNIFSVNYHINPSDFSNDSPALQ